MHDLSPVVQGTGPQLRRRRQRMDPAVAKLRLPRAAKLTADEVIVVERPPFVVQDFARHCVHVAQLVVR